MEKIIKLQSTKLGPVLNVEYCIQFDKALLLVVTPGKGVMPNDDTNEVVSAAFIWIVEQFIKDNNIDFKPNGDFDSKDASDSLDGGWEFRVHGEAIDPMEYFIENL